MAAVIMLIAILLFSITSCKKSVLSPNTSDESTLTEDKQDDGSTSARCLVTHTEDDLFGYTLDIFYNAAGNPDSMSFDGGFPATMEYDSKESSYKI